MRILFQLSKRERQVIALVLGERSLKEMAYELRVDEKTVSCHKRSAMRKLGVANDVALTKLAIRLDLEHWLQWLAHPERESPNSVVRSNRTTEEALI